MSLIHPLTFSSAEAPFVFPSPFDNIPHPLVWRAVLQLQELLTTETFHQTHFLNVKTGTRFAVLLVENSSGDTGFLAGFSGQFSGQWLLPGFVPPLFDINIRETIEAEFEKNLASITHRIQKKLVDEASVELVNQLKIARHQSEVEIQVQKKLHQARKTARQKKRELITSQNLDAHAAEKSLTSLAHESQQDKRERQALLNQWREQISGLEELCRNEQAVIDDLQWTRDELQIQKQKQLFDLYEIGNFRGEVTSLQDHFPEPIPPTGAGDCAAVKVLHHAQQHHLQPVAMAEFWWGPAPEGEIRHHGSYYPACRSKCGVLLPYMLQGIKVRPRVIPSLDVAGDNQPDIVYEDDDLVVVNKPHGMLSVPGKETQISVLSWLQNRYPQATGPLLVHRLDLSTSGLLLAAKNLASHKILQQQFISRQVEKRYVAVLSGELKSQLDNGVIDLPLRVDLDDRPRQLVCYQYGKPALTRWQLIGVEDGKTRVYFYPLTGRTHQLRIHAAHSNGLNMPIEGDELYGVPGDRLLLHAQRLCFNHPGNGKRMEIESPVPF